MKRFFVAISLFITAISSADPIPVVTTTPDIAWLVREIGGNLVAVDSLLKGTENAHFVDAVPSYIRRVADAKVVCGVGLDLEVGWLPKVLTRSGNNHVQPGSSGYCDVGKAITVLEKPTGEVNRSMGDVHPSGNPHYFLSPTAVSEGAKAIADTLIAVDPANATKYRANLAKLREKIASVKKEISAKLAKAYPKGLPLVMEYHRELTYFFHAYGFKSHGSLEEKPGVPPSAGRIAEVATGARAAGVVVLVSAPYAPHKTLEKFSEVSDIPAITPPLSIKLNGPPADYSALENGIADAIINSRAKAGE